MRRSLAVAIAILVVGAAAAWFLRPGDSVTLENYQKIRLGMTLDEVSELIGRPGVDEEELWVPEGILPFPEFSEMNPCVPNEKVTARTWMGQKAAIKVVLSGSRVSGKQFSALQGPAETRSLLERVRAWLAAGE